MSKQKETFGFQAEVKELLKLVVHSLYSNKDIFLRELVSNSSDAAEKLRFQALDDNTLYGDDSDLAVKISIDKENRTITISDNGIGMTREEVMANLGTIAKSGTKAFLDKLSGDNSKDSQMIGQFGVGFYSAYLVSDKVTVNTLKAGENPENAISWVSAGDGEFSLEKITKANRGTEIILHLKADEDEFLDDYKLKSLISKYSDFIAMPIKMLEKKRDDKGEEAKESTWESVNKAKAIWLRDKSDISDEEYQDFYKAISSDYSNPLLWSHNKVEGNLEYTSLLYIPENKPFDMFDREKKTGLQLYVQRTFIMENEELLPNYMRFVKGLIDSNDLPLNVSREILQQNRTLDKIKKASTKKVLDVLSKLAKNKPAEYLKFWLNFGQILKEGVVEETDLKEKLAKLFRFASTHNDDATVDVSFDEYIARMPEKQKNIYYVTAENFITAKNNPQLGVFNKKGIEVLLLSDRVDEWMTSHLTEYAGKTLKSITKGDLDLGDFDTEEDKKEVESTAKEYKSVLEQIKKVLDGKVEDVKISQRLTDSPSCIVTSDNGMSLHMQKLMAEAGQSMMGMMGGGSKPILEINPEHQLIKNMHDMQDDDTFADCSELLFQQAILVEGGQLENPASFIKLVNKYLSV